MNCGLQLNRPQQAIVSSLAPKSFEAALATTENLLKLMSSEVSGEQLLDYFNVFLAPFVRGIEAEKTREGLHLFLTNLNQTLGESDSVLPASIGIELGIPNFLQDEKAIGPDGKRMGVYADYMDEAHLLATSLCEIVLEESKHRPFFQPNLIVKLRAEDLANKKSQPFLFLAHRLAAETGLPLFANLGWPEQNCASYFATGSRLSNNWKGDWELDALRTGAVDSVLVNLPRLAYECEQKMSRYYELLDEQLEMALRALEIKHQTIKLRAREGLLPVLTHAVEGERYARLENFTRLIGFVGLNEAVESLTAKQIYEDQKAMETSRQIMAHINDYVQKGARKPETRTVTAMVPAMAAAKRLAQLDVERYGWARVHVGGTKERPFYTDLVAVSKQASPPLDLRLKAEERLQQLAPGGHLISIRPEDEQTDANRLLEVSKKLCSETKIGLFTFHRVLTYCSRCKRLIRGQPAKCPLCGSADSVTSYARSSENYMPVAN
jgi:ribonucleoside-triphosphate reductase